MACIIICHKVLVSHLSAVEEILRVLIVDDLVLPAEDHYERRVDLIELLLSHVAREFIHS